MSHENDGALVEAILAGDTARFAEVVARHDRRVRAVIGRAGVRGKGDVEDVVQRSFYLAFCRLAQLGAAKRLEPWLVRIAERCAADHFRARARARRGMAPLPEAPAAPRRREGEESWIWEEVDSLAGPFRRILRLRYEKGLSYAEIARELSVAESTVRGRLYEARRALRERLIEEDRR